MLRLSKLADYSFILLTQMVSGNDKSWSAAELAENTSLPQPTVAKIMKLLAKSDIVSAQRGASGGYRLAKAPEATTVADVIEAVDGPIALTGCVNNKEPDCAAHSFCCMRGGWDKVNRATRDALATVSLDDLCVNPFMEDRK